MLRFAEEIMLLMLDEDGRELVRMPMWSMRTVSAASVLMDLALENRIDTDLDRLFVVDPRPLQDDLPDPTLTRVTGAEIHDTNYWLEHIAEYGENIREQAITRLAERGILRHRGNPSPWAFRSRRYPIADGCALYYLFFPTWVAVTFIADVCFSLAFVYCIHWEYDKPDSRLDRFHWFRRGRALHKIHHSYVGEEFSRSRNDAFGGPLAGNLVDYLLGTFKGQEVLEEASCFPVPGRLSGFSKRTRNALAVGMMPARGTSRDSLG